MSYHLFLTGRANKQIVQALDWYKEQAPGHEVKLLKAIELAFKNIQKNPLKYQVRYDDVRIKFLKTYKFGIHYSLNQKTIFLLGFFHQSQNDDNWAHRS